MASFSLNYLFKGPIFKYSHTEGKGFNTGILRRHSSVLTTSLCITSVSHHLPKLLSVVYRVSHIQKRKENLTKFLSLYLLSCFIPSSQLPDWNGLQVPFSPHCTQSWAALIIVRVKLLSGKHLGSKSGRTMGEKLF